MSMEAIYGVPRSLFDFMGRMNSLAQQRSARVDESSNARFERKAALLEAELDLWRLVHDDEIAAEPTLEKRSTQLASEAFEWAIRLRLHQIVNGYDHTHPKSRQATAQILAAISALRFGSRVEGSLLFPIVIAGAAVEREEQRAVLRQRLMVMENTLGFGHITAALKLLEKIWLARSTSLAEQNNSKIVNWASIRYHQFPGIVFL
ncbi:hypothetical protein MBLNU459_g7052t2 [Dothideomycetes sp. NU459]